MASLPRRQNIRPRPLDHYKRMPLARSTAELVFEDETGAVQKLMSVDASSIQTTMPKRKRLNIPMPPVMRNDDPERDALHSGFEQPDHYIRLPRKVTWADDDTLLYALTQEDMLWLRDHPILGPHGEMPELLTEDLLEEMIDVLEKTAKRGSLSQHQAEHLFMCKFDQNRPTHGAMWSEVYQFWHAKRHRLKRPLLRKFWPVTSVNDNNPHKVFRPREKERYKLRRNRRNDLDAFRRMQQLRRDFEKLKGVVALVRHRERVKQALLDARRDRFLQLIHQITDTSGLKRLSSIDIPRLREELKPPVVDPNPAVPFAAEESGPEGSVTGAESMLESDAEGSVGSAAATPVKTARKRSKKDRKSQGKRRSRDELDLDSDSAAAAIPKGNDKTLHGSLTQPSFMEVNPHRHRIEVGADARRDEPWGALSPHIYQVTPAAGGKATPAEGLASRVLRFARLTAGADENLAKPVMDPEPAVAATLAPGQIPRRWRFRARVGRGGRLLVDRFALHPRESEPQVQVLVAGGGRAVPEPTEDEPKGGLVARTVNLMRIREIAEMTDSEEETLEYVDPDTNLFPEAPSSTGLNFILPA